MSGDALLVVTAHPDDEALGFAGVIHRARATGRRVVVAVVTNGDHPRRGRALPARGARPGDSSRTVRYGLLRGSESVAAMRVLGLGWSVDPERSDVLLLGYRDGLLGALGRGEDARDPTGLRRTYAYRPGRLPFGGDGDFRRLLDGGHSELSAEALAADLDAVFAFARPAEVYTHASFDGHPDHAEVHRQVAAAAGRAGAATLRTTLIHPAGTADTMYESAFEWPNPARVSDEPLDRFTPWLEFESPGSPGGDGWGPLGSPHELVPVPPAMLEPDPARNLKWRSIACYRSQLHSGMTADGRRHPAAGYLRAFVKRSEFFWNEPVVPRRRAVGSAMPSAALRG